MSKRKSGMFLTKNIPLFLRGTVTVAENLFSNLSKYSFQVFIFLIQLQRF